MIDTKQLELQRNKLDPEKLLKEAQATAGLTDYGDMSFVGPMKRFLSRAAAEVDFTSEGIDLYKADVIRYLVNRLRTQAELQRYPEILREDVSDPIIVIGLPRSGTTKLQRILAAPSDAQKLLMWRMLNPARFPDAIPGQPDPRMAAVGISGYVAGDDQNISELAQAAHATTMCSVDEEFILFDLALDESVAGFDTRIPVFNYTDWVPGGERQADRNAYRYVRTLLQYLQWQDGGKRNRPWILKTVFHIAHLDALLECFPNATLVHCHRDPQSSIPSFAKLMWAVWAAKANVDKKEVGEKVLGWGAAVMDRYLEARARLRLDDRIIDAKYETIRDDIMTVIREVYRRAGREMTKEAEQSILQWEKQNEHGNHAHAYSLEEFGLTKDDVDHAFAAYLSRFIDRKPG